MLRRLQMPIMRMPPKPRMRLLLLEHKGTRPCMTLSSFKRWPMVRCPNGYSSGALAELVTTTTSRWPNFAPILSIRVACLSNRAWHPRGPFGVGQSCTQGWASGLTWALLTSHFAWLQRRRVHKLDSWRGWWGGHYKLGGETVGGAVGKVRDTNQDINLEP